MKTTRAHLATALLAATLLTPVACSNTPLVAETALTPPTGMKPAQIESAIRGGIARANQGSTGTWVVEKSTPGVLVAGLRVRTHYLQVTYGYTPARISSTITASENLNEGGGTIHKRAITWHQRLDAYVQQELVYVGSPKA